MPPVVGFVGAIVSGITSAITAVSGLVGSFFGGWAGLGAFLASPIGSLIIGIGLQLAMSLFVSKPRAPTMEAGKVNVRLPEPERWLNGGEARQGGGVLFAEFDADGNFWYVVVHSDSIMTGTPIKRYFDDVEITLDASGDVITDEFCLNKKKDKLYSGEGVRTPYFRVWTTTYTETNPTPPGIADLMTAFPGKWTTDHKLVGTTYSVIRIKPLKIQYRHLIYKWRGPVGVGEPAVSVVALWSNVYDPRDGTQTNGVPATYKPTRNPVLLWAWYRTHKRGRNKPRDSINWDKIAEQANICDSTVAGIQGSQPRYECGVAIPESKERHIGEQEILMTCDAQLVFDDDGKCWPRVGYYYVPTLHLYRNRDIVAMESVEAQNGESETDGVIVRYTDKLANYTVQPSAAWVNPLYYVPGTTPRYLKIDALGIQNHNQAMRLAKSIGLRSQPLHKLLPTVGLRGLKARQERVIDLNYDNTFAGDYEIVTPVEVDKVGIFCGFGLVPIDENRFDLLPGEEKPRPVFTDAQESSIPAMPTGVDVDFVDGRIEITFDAPTRDDIRYEFEYINDADYTGTDADIWSQMTVQMDEKFAFSGGVPQNRNWKVRWRSVSSGGRASDWLDPPFEISSTTLTLSGTPVTTGTVGIAYAGFTIGVTGGQTPYIFADLYGRLPPGIVLNSSTGQVSGTPTTPGTYENIMIRVQDYDGSFNSFPLFNITIS